jgi:hypothetical protein
MRVVQPSGNSRIDARKAAGDGLNFLATFHLCVDSEWRIEGLITLARIHQDDNCSQFVLRERSIEARGPFPDTKPIGAVYGPLPSPSAQRFNGSLKFRHIFAHGFASVSD